MSSEIFNLYWRQSLDDADASFSKSRNTSDPVPHAFRLEAGELLLSAWVGSNADNVEAVVAGISAAAERMLLGEFAPADAFEAELWEHLRSIREPQADSEEVGAEYEAPQPSNPVTLIRIELVGSNITLPAFRPRHIVLGEDVIPVQSPLLIAPPRPHAPQLTVRLRVQDMMMKGYTTELGHRLTTALVRFGDLYELIKHGNAIFEGNVRGFVGMRGVTNQRLVSVYRAIAEGESGGDTAVLFPFLNNGITICHTGQSAPADSLLLVNPQIINGQQTVRTWHRVYERYQDNAEARHRLENIEVLVRLVQLVTEADAKAIAFANNRQNAVSALDLRSNDRCMKAIEECFLQRGGQVRFQRKSGELAPGVTAIDAGHIHRLWCDIEDARVAQEEFFDSDASFNTLFEPLAEVLSVPEKVDRLIGLYYVSRISAGSKKRAGLVRLLDDLGVRKNSMGDEERGNPDVRRRLVYAAWPLINKAILHVLLKDAEWHGTNQRVTYFTQKGRRWVPHPDLMKLVSSVKLSSGLITELVRTYKDWYEINRDAYEDDEEEVLPAIFIKEQVDLHGFAGKHSLLNMLGVPRASLILDL